LELTEQLDVDNRYLKAKVISVGNLVEGVKNGDTIHHDSHAGNGMTWKDKLYHVITIRDVVIVE
jgi:co-chaperonin GroES (HSP10)